MPRPKRIRKLIHPPIFNIFRPAGRRGRMLTGVTLSLDEYESIKLCDYEGLTQDEASKTLEVSRPTLTRIYGSARQKIAMALIEGRELRIEGGAVDYDENWYRCEKCSTVFNDVTDGTDVLCPRCAHDIIKPIVSESVVFETKSEKFDLSSKSSFCRCAECGTRISHRRGRPCAKEVCPNCSKPMTREDSIDIDHSNADCLWAVPCFDESLNSKFNTRFGKSPYFALIAKDNVRFVKNPFNLAQKNIGLLMLNQLYGYGITGLVSGYVGDNVVEKASELDIEILIVDNNMLTVNDLLLMLKSKNHERENCLSDDQRKA